MHTKIKDPFISGFTIIKNGLTLGYPFKESIESISPLCNEIIISVGFDDPNLEKDDGTWDYLQKHFQGDKYQFIKSWWDPAISARGEILSQQTNIALSKCRGKYCQYIQGDESLHQDDIKKILSAVQEMENNQRVEGLVFNYVHFYGNTDIVKKTRNVYRREVRLIRNHLGIQSWRDAQGFKHKDLTKLKCKMVDANVYHYGWARSEVIMNKKYKAFEKLYHGESHQSKDFKYQRIWGLKPFLGTHPKEMKDWIENHRNNIDIMSLPLHFQWSNIGLALSDCVEKWTNYRIGEYKNYKLL